VWGGGGGGGAFVQLGVHADRIRPQVTLHGLAIRKNDDAYTYAREKIQRFLHVGHCRGGGGQLFAWNTISRTLYDHCDWKLDISETCTFRDAGKCRVVFIFTSIKINF
jgi:hypothetical protein